METLPFLLYLALGTAISFAGALPLGIVNLSVVDITLRENFRTGFQISLGATLIEVLQFLLALFVGLMVLDYLESHLWVKAISVVLFVAIGVVFLLRKQMDRNSCPRWKFPPFFQGIGLALINPQALPYWVFAIAGLQAAHLIMLDSMTSFSLLFWFIIGVAAGKLLALALFGALSIRIAQRAQAISRRMNLVIALVMFMIAGYQGWQLVLA